MMKCRLKIIASNIINDIDTPEIKYISQNENIDINYDNNEEQNKNEMNELDEINFNNNKNEENIEQNYNNKIDQLEQIDELINIELANYNRIGNNNSKLNEIKNIDSNELYTISNQHIYDDKYFSANISNYNTISNYYGREDKKSTSFNTNDSKRNDSNQSLKYVFRKRENKNYMNRSLSNKHSNGKNDKKYNLIKDIFKTHPVNYNYSNLKLFKGNKSTNKVGNILNININKSFCINNNIKINHKNLLQNRAKNKSNKKSKERSKENSKIGSKERSKKGSKERSKKGSKERSNQNSKSKKENKNEIIKEEKNLLKNVKPLKFNKRTNKNKLLNSVSSSFSWNYVENNEIDIESQKDYKKLIDELILEEKELNKEKEKIIQTYEEKLRPLRELNQKLINNNNEDLDKEDELRGELVILKNQYEKLTKQNQKYNSNIIKEKEDTEINNKEKEAENDIKDLYDKLDKGEILLVTKPANFTNISEKEEKNIILMLKGLFYNIHIRDTDEIVNLIWKKDKQIQTIYFLVNELFQLFNLEDTEKNLMINFFYSFCKKFNSIDETMFKKEFKEKIGNIPLYNKNTYVSKLMNYNGNKFIELIKLMPSKDTFNLGVLNLEQINELLNNLGLLSDSSKDFEDDYEFIIIIMKKDRSLNLVEGNKSKSENIIKFSLFDLFYESLIDIIEDFGSNIIFNPIELIRNYMRKNEINNAELLLKPLLTNNNIIKINNKEYLDIDILNKYLRKLEIIKLNEAINIIFYEEELVDINKFIDDINNYVINNETKEDNKTKVNEVVSELFNDIFEKS